MLILALVFHCVDPILTIASILSSKPLMAINPENRDDVAKSVVLLSLFVRLTWEQNPAVLCNHEQ
jgi:predicted aconitase with swiveling domain